MQSSHNYGAQSSYIGSIQALSAYYDEEEMQDGSTHSSIRNSLHTSLERAPSSPLPFAVEEDSAVDGDRSQLMRQNSQDHQTTIHEGQHSPVSEEGGVVILNPDEDEHDDNAWDNSLHLEQHHLHLEPEEPVDSIIVAAAAQVDAQRGGDSFEQLFKQAGSGHESKLEVEEGEHSQKSFWERSRGNTPADELISTQSQQPIQSTANQMPQHPPIRATQLSHDKFRIEVDILPNDNRANPRDAMDILANVDLLHLWFDPIPAVFDSTIKDGSGTYSPSNSNERQERHRDGEWVEISTPPLILPRDSRISSCLRFFRVKFRTLIGFPARIRSTILIERSAGRMCMTIGPYPDGMMAYHDFNVRMEQEHRIVVADEVRLQRVEAESSYFYCFFCSILRWIMRVIQWVFVRWYQPDLASYMSQTTASMEKLRLLIERGEGAAFAADEFVMEGGDLEGGENVTLISAPLLG